DPPRNADPAPLIALADGDAQELAQVSVSRQSEAVLSITGAGSTGIQLTSPAAAFTHEFEISSAKAQPVKDLRIRVNPFQAADGEQITPSVSVAGAPLADQDYAVPGLGSLRFTINAPLAAAGDYDSAITLTYSGQQSSVPLKVTRSHVALSIAVTDAGTHQRTVTPFTDNAFTFPLEVRETEGRTVKLPVPSVVLKRKDGEAEFVVPPGDIKLDGATTPHEVKPEAVETVDVTISTLDDAGEYTARLRFPG